MNLQGTGVALITPFLEDGSIDFEGLSKVTKHAIDGGVEYLVLLGSTAEAITLDIKEKKRILKHVKDLTKGETPLVVGVGGSSTAFVIQEIQALDLSGISGILISSPAYNKPSQQGIFEHYSTIAKSVDLPIIMYNVPGRTASNMEPETILKLANEIPNIVAIKEAAPSINQAYSVLNKKPENFHVISGDDELALNMTLAGGSGVISVIGQALPKEFSTMIRLALDGNSKEAHKIFHNILAITRLIYTEGNPTGIKALFSEINICDATTRLPLIEASNSLKMELNQLLNKLHGNS